MFLGHLQSYLVGLLWYNQLDSPCLMFTGNSQVSFYLWTTPPPDSHFLVMASKEKWILIDNWVTYSSL